MLLLPTGMYMLGSAAAVVVSFAVIALLPSPFFSRLLQPGSAPSSVKAESILPSAVTLAFLAVLVFAGYAGSRDPLENPLPLAVWTL